jgi:hypothetical protein
MQEQKYSATINRKNLEKPADILRLHLGFGKAIVDNNFAFLSRHIKVILDDELLLIRMIEHSITTNRPASLAFLLESINNNEKQKEHATYGINSPSIQGSNTLCIDILIYFGGSIHNSHEIATSLRYAAQSLNTEVVKRLIYHGADSATIKNYVKGTEQFRNKDHALTDMILGEQKIDKSMLQPTGATISIKISDFANIEDDYYDKKLVDTIFELMSAIENTFS